jgi:hypothetical protein
MTLPPFFIILYNPPLSLLDKEEWKGGC